MLTVIFSKVVGGDLGNRRLKGKVDTKDYTNISLHRANLNQVAPSTSQGPNINKSMAIALHSL